MRDLLIFDCDGTLVDTLTDVGRCFNMALAACGFPQHPIAAYGGFVGGNLETVVSKLLPGDMNCQDNVDRVKGIYRRIYAEDPKPNTLPFDGIQELLYCLKRDGFSLAVNSNKAQALTEKVIQKHFPADTFDAIVAYDENRPSKPDPYGVEAICRVCGKNLNSAIYIGDGRSDVLTAKNAKIPCIFVTWGQGTLSDCMDYENCYVANNVGELGEMLRSNRF